MRKLVLALILGVLTPLPANAGGSAAPVSFDVVNIHEPLGTATIHGSLFSPDCDASSVVVLMHGLSYTRDAWDVPGYSVVDPLLDAGYAVVTIDRLGYGESALANGYNVSSEAHAKIAAQIVSQLRDDYSHVSLAGHSAGAETALLATGAFGHIGKPDAVAALGYHHFPSTQIVSDFFTGDFVRAATDDYEYFLGTPDHRAWMFFTAAADPQVVEADADAAVLTPSGEIYSIGKQPSRYVAGLVNVPTFLQFGDSDRLFEVSYAEFERALFVSAPSVTVDVVEDAGHTFMLHPTGPAGAERLADWVAQDTGSTGCTD